MLPSIAGKRVHVGFLKMVTSHYLTQSSIDEFQVERSQKENVDVQIQGSFLKLHAWFEICP